MKFIVVACAAFLVLVILGAFTLGMCQAARRGDEQMRAEDERGQK